eukprot:5045889-Pleurochrysis_carterae.AAC.1
MAALCGVRAAQCQPTLPKRRHTFPTDLPAFLLADFLLKLDRRQLRAPACSFALRYLEHFNIAPTLSAAEAEKRRQNALP